MVDAVLCTERQILIADDFNSRPLERGMPHSDSRLTFRRLDCDKNFPDVTFASEPQATLVGGWRVLEDILASDHQYIAFEVADLRIHQTGAPVAYGTSQA